MPVTITEYLRPNSLKEALEVLARDHTRHVVVGGGVSVVLSGAPRRVRAVDLARTGLDKISRTDDSLELGATVTLDDIVRSPLAATLAHGLLPRALRTAASESIRRLITVGGNIVQCYYWATLPPLLLALDAKIHLRTAEHRRTLTAQQFFAQPPMRQLQPGELVTHVSIPIERARRSGFEKMAKTSNDYALIHAVVTYALSRGRIDDPRVVVSACTNLPVRCLAAEEFLLGKAPELATALQAGQLAAQHLTLRRDFRASNDYRRRILAVLVQRAVLDAALDSPAQHQQR